MSYAFIVEKGIPIPGSRVGKYPFGEMEVGDSFEAPNTAAVRRCAALYGARNGKRFTCRVAERGSKSLRVWRVA